MQRNGPVLETEQVKKLDMCVMFCEPCYSFIIYDIHQMPDCCPYCGGKVRELSQSAYPILPKDVPHFLNTEEKVREAFKNYYSGKFSLLTNNAQEAFENLRFQKVYWPSWFSEQWVGVSCRATLEDDYRESRTEYDAYTGRSHKEYDTRTESQSISTMVDLKTSEFSYGAPNNMFCYEIDKLLKNSSFDLYHFNPEEISPEEWIPIECLTTGEREATEKIERDFMARYPSLIQDALESSYSAQRIIVDWYDSPTPQLKSLDYLVVPIWVAHYKENNEIYTYIVVDGYLGKITGALPIDKEKESELRRRRTKKTIIIISCIVGGIMLHTFICNFASWFLDLLSRLLNQLP